jgi:hypothetical protein
MGLQFTRRYVGTPDDSVLPRWWFAHSLSFVCDPGFGPERDSQRADVRQKSAKGDRYVRFTVRKPHGAEVKPCLKIPNYRAVRTMTPVLPKQRVAGSNPVSRSISPHPRSVEVR